MNRTIRALRLLALAVAALALVECGSSSDGAVACPEQRPVHGQACSGDRFCDYPDPCAKSCSYPFHCVDGKWELGDVCAYGVSCPSSPAGNGDSCFCPEKLPEFCRYGSCVGGDKDVIATRCIEGEPVDGISYGTVEVSLEPCQ
jgi:hypothetical protein